MALTNQIRPKVLIYDLHPPLEDFRAEVLAGLSQVDKSISPKFLYDQQGAKLFEAICTLEEYYLTRTEISILQAHAPEIANLINNSTLIEFGSGSSQKVQILLDAAPQLKTYVALDISQQHLYSACVDLAIRYPSLETVAICTDYTQPLDLANFATLRYQHHVGFFPGSTIGNLEPQAAIEFLKNAAAILGANSGLIIGVDLKKPKEILEPAYDDTRGISAAFALNLLNRINRELDANFDLNAFTYRAFYNPIGRIEMYLVSLHPQTVQIDDVEIAFQAGETLRTEYSYKYTIEEFWSLARLAGFCPKQVWTDADQLFSIHYLSLD
jgi:dimethylhistidine N-methyltransferase